MRGAKSADSDGPSEYECETCPAITRAIRGCSRGDVPEVIALRRVAPGVALMLETADDVAKALRKVKWKTTEARNLGAAIVEAHDMAALITGGSCALNDINRVSWRVINHYRVCNQFVPSGQVPLPMTRLEDCSARMVQGFSIVHSEGLRLDRIARKAKKS